MSNSASQGTFPASQIHSSIQSQAANGESGPANEDGILGTLFTSE